MEKENSTSSTAKRISRTKTFIVQRLSSRTICKVLCNRLVLAFFMGMLCLELISTFVMDIEWPVDLEDADSFHPIDIEKKKMLEQMLDFDLLILENKTKAENQNEELLLKKEKLGLMYPDLSVDDVLDIQEGRKKADDRYLVEYIRRMLIMPSNRTWNLTDPGLIDVSQAGQGMYIDTILHNKRNGFFVECGAGNGEDMSETLFLERVRNWTGLLIEPHPQDFHTLLYKRRKAHSLNACVSPKNDSSLHVLRATRGFLSGIKGYVDELHKGAQFSAHAFYQGDVIVQCFPFASIIAALGPREIDYLSLDVQGAEVDILETIPFESIRINSLAVEYRVQGLKWDQEARSLQKLTDIRKVMRGTGLYQEVGILIDQPQLASITNQDFRERYGLYVVFKRKEPSIILQALQDRGR